MSETNDEPPAAADRKAGRGLSGILDATTAAIRRSDFGYQLGLIGFCRFTNLLRLWHYAPAIHPRYAGRVLLLVTASLASTPLRLWESIRFGRQVSRVRIDAPPIFIVGHWRSGTTHLHNLMSQDTAFGYFSMYQAMVPDCSLVGGTWLKSLLSRLVPLTRPMDAMVWPMDAPQEEEIALAKIMPHAFYTRFLVPRKAAHLFAKYVLLRGAPPAFLREFKRKYERMLQIATLHAQGRRLLLKNPVNTARIGLLLELFPDAKFIHIHRSPYEVFASTRHLYGRLLRLTTLQTIDERNATETILALYAAMMEQFLADRSRIPAGNLVEVRYDDLDRDPLGELRRVYATLGLAGYAAAEPAFAAYADAQRSYRKNRLTLAADERRQIEERWSFAFAAFDYPVAAAEP